MGNVTAAEIHLELADLPSYSAALLDLESICLDDGKLKRLLALIAEAQQKGD
jgi:hypothetical protein